MCLYNCIYCLLVLALIIAGISKLPKAKHQEINLDEIAKSKDPQRIDVLKWFNEQSSTLVFSWIKSLSSFTPILLAGCLTYFFVPTCNSAYPNVRTWVGIIAFAAIINMFFSTIYWISNFFSMKWRLGMINNNIFLRVITSINEILVNACHICLLISLFVQLYCAGAVIISISSH